ncbi:hypothetical protein [Nocardia sp. CC227C]|uniref:hypothetical protein n=1 Tax=Nocardia sp. CC227C TaxID=3044562 RepID=UPI00278BF501|nr:hypothetical protein [Nocardia sp. CC227C]
MSDTGGVTNRNRRRAVRSEGPPPEAAAGTSRVPEATASAAGGTVEATATVELGKPEETTATEPVARDGQTESAEPLTAQPVLLDKAAEGDGAESVPQPPAAADAVSPGPSAPTTVASEGPAAPSAAGVGWQRIVAVAAVLLAVVLMGGTGYLVHLRGEIAADNALRADYVQTAKQAMLNITNISADTASDDIKRVLEVTSGELAAEYDQRKDDYAGIVQKAEVRAKGEVIDAAIESSDDHSAIVLVAVKQTLTNAGAEGPQQRQFRFRVTIAHTDKGLAATRMEMVI